MKISKKVLFYISMITVMAIALTLFISSQYTFVGINITIFWIILAAISESLGIILPNGIGLSVSFATHLACIIIGGPFLAVIVSASSCIFCVIKTQNGYSHIFNTPFYKTIFNISELIISAGVAGLVYIYSGGIIGHFLVLPTVLAVMAYLFINNLILSRLMAFLHNESLLRVWINSIKGVFLNIIAVGMIGVILALAYMSYGPAAVVLFFGPLLLARFSFKLYINMRSTYLETIHAFNKFVEAKDTYTSGHSARVQKYAEMIALAAKLPDQKVQKIKTAALLHDIGKVGISDSILKKPLSLTFDEYEEIKNHVVIGAEILEGVDFLKDISEIIRQHHERHDGKGYPSGLKNGDICIEAAILSLADVYDAMTSDRPYRHAMSKQEALEELRINSGTQFDPELTESFIKILENLSEKDEEMLC